MFQTSALVITGRIRTAAILLIVCTAFSAAAGAQGPLGLLGAEIQSPRTVIWNAPLHAGDAVMNARPALATPFVGIGSAGYAWDRRFRTEMETKYQPAGFHKIPGVDSYGFVRATAVSANVVYALASGKFGTAYVGGGVGVNRLEWPQATNRAALGFTESTTSVQWHGKAGVMRRISPRLDAFVDYRRVSSSKSRLMNQSAGSTINAKRDRSHNILAGVRFAFNP
jgi:opacity protein-like surface antigen